MRALPDKHTATADERQPPEGDRQTIQQSVAATAGQEASKQVAAPPTSLTLRALSDHNRRILAHLVKQADSGTILCHRCSSHSSSID